jgi:hypothetical protein
MALKVVPAGDERCDIHNGRKPATYICKDCLKELGVEAGPSVSAGRGPFRRLRRRLRRGPLRPIRHLVRRSGVRHRRGLVLASVIGLGVAAAAIALIAGGGGGENVSGPPTEAEVVNALDLSPNPDGTGWITLDGACDVSSILLGASRTPPTVDPTMVATNEAGTVRAIVEASFSLSQEACVNRIRAELRDDF